MEPDWSSSSCTARAAPRAAHGLLVSYLLGAAVLWVCGCSSVPRVSRSYYEAGLSALESDSCSDAEREFSMAIQTAGTAFYTEAHLARGECLLRLRDNEKLAETQKAKNDRARLGPYGTRPYSVDTVSSRRPVRSSSSPYLHACGAPADRSFG